MRLLMVSGLLALIVLVSGCVQPPPEEIIMTPPECIARGGRTVNIAEGEVCNEDETNIGEVKGLTSTHICCVPGRVRITREEAIEIAQNSDCVKEGTLTDVIMYNEVSQTWWIDLVPFTEKEFCPNPACVVKEATKTASINWRCMGVLPPECTDITTGESMNLSEALEIASASECATEGTLPMDYSCNQDTGTWWIDIEPFTERPGCNPACVVEITTKQASINWRCTGVVPG